MNDGWTETIVIKHNSMFDKEHARLLAVRISNDIPKMTNGSWKPVGMGFNDFEIEIQCKYVEGETYNGKE